MWKWNTEYTKKCGNNTGSYAGKSITYLGGEQYERVQKAYGFYGIPFIVLIDKKGRILARGLRGEKVREEILKARMNVE